MKIFVIIGTRPEALKMIPLIKRIKARHSRLLCKVVLTGQHREMVDELLKLFAVKADYDLNIMSIDQKPSLIVSNIIQQMQLLLEREKPDWLLVQGDTSSAMAAAISAFYNNIKVGHVEAGLRSGDKTKPFPEEVNRKLITSASDFHFAPTIDAVNNLRAENVSLDSIFLTGNTIIDILEESRDKISSNHFIKQNISHTNGSLRILVTAHRRESIGKGIDNICEAIKRLCIRYKDRIKITWPVHPNPNVSNAVYSSLADLSQVDLVKPLNYMDMLHNMINSYFIMTDSGGIQEEAPALGKPVLVLREMTERPEGIKAGTAKLTGLNSENIYNDAVELIENSEHYNKMAQIIYPYGQVGAAEKIVDALLNNEEQMNKGSIYSEMTALNGLDEEFNSGSRVKRI